MLSYVCLQVSLKIYFLINFWIKNKKAVIKLNKLFLLRVFKIYLKMVDKYELQLHEII